jgi:transcriptional regulator with XRE-family HTH domain
MGISEPVAAYFRNRLKNERNTRNWSQAKMADLLSDKGLEGVYATTIAKIEAGDRAARIDEIAAVADVFEVSVDTLLGRSVNPKHDLMFALRALADAANQASWQVESIETTLRDRIVELAAFNSEAEPDALAKSFQSGCERACDALAEANDALHDALNPPGSAQAQRSMRKLLLNWLSQEEK